jgi:excisionase family DNA binding protein
MVHVTYKKAEEILHQNSFQPRELARLLGTSEQFLFNEVWKGKLRAIKIGNDIVRFERSDVLEWLHARQP